jgi:glycosyltransferase involved in cell wall biosynthesis
MAETNNFVLAIPMYNCRNEITSVLKDIEAVKPKKISCIWIIDNQSTDGSVQAVQAYLVTSDFPYPVVLFQNDKNIGFGGTHKLIFSKILESNFSSVVVLHGDYQARAIDLGKMLQRKNVGELATLGSRFMTGSSRTNYSKLRVFWNLFFNLVLSVRYKSKVLDLGSGLNIFPKSAILAADFKTLPNDLTFNVELLKRLLSKRYPIEWYPIEWVSENQKSNVRIFSQTSKTLRFAFGGNIIESLEIVEPRIVFEYRCDS